MEEYYLVKHSTLANIANDIRELRGIEESIKLNDIMHHIYDILKHPRDLYIDNLKQSCTFVRDYNKTYVPRGMYQDFVNLSNVGYSKAVTIEAEAFSGCISLRGFPAGSSVREIGYRAFYNCKELTEITIESQNSLHISSEAFLNCSKLEKFEAYTCNFFESNRAFSGTSMKAFIMRSDEFYAAAYVPSDVFENTPIANGQGYIYVPRHRISLYQEYWGDYINQFRALEDYTVDGTITGALDPYKI